MILLICWLVAPFALPLIGEPIGLQVGRGLLLMTLLFVVLAVGMVVWTVWRLARKEAFAALQIIAGLLFLAGLFCILFGAPSGGDLFVIAACAVWILFGVSIVALFVRGFAVAQGEYDKKREIYQRATRAGALGAAFLIAVVVAADWLFGVTWSDGVLVAFPVLFGPVVLAFFRQGFVSLFRTQSVGPTAVELG